MEISGAKRLLEWEPNVALDKGFKRVIKRLIEKKPKLIKVFE